MDKETKKATFFPCGDSIEIMYEIMRDKQTENAGSSENAVMDHADSEKESDVFCLGQNEK